MREIVALIEVLHNECLVDALTWKHKAAYVAMHFLNKGNTLRDQNVWVLITKDVSEKTTAKTDDALKRLVERWKKKNTSRHS